MTLSQLFSRHVFTAKMPSGALNELALATIQPKPSLIQGGHFSPLHSAVAAEAEALSLQERMMTQTIYALTGALEAKDAYTCGHSRAVAQYATRLCSALQMPGETIEHIRLASLLHDIGKIGVPEAILNKAGPLTSAEWDIMAQHPVIGARQILSPIAGLSPILPYVEHHHEHWDGSGGPMGLSGENIPLGARIVSIVDAYHALTSRRSYRDALSKSEALKILNEGAGIMWYPNLLQIFLKMIPG